MSYTAAVTDATGINHHHDQKIFMRGKLSSRLGQISSIYNSKDDGPTLSLAKDFIYGTKIVGSFPRCNGVDVNITKDFLASPTSQYAPTILSSLGLSVPSPKDGIASLIALPRMALKLSSKIISSSMGVTAKWNTSTNTADVSGEIQMNKRFDIADSIKGNIKGDIRQTLLNKNWTYETPILNLSLKASERSREHGLSYNSKRGRITAFSATTLPILLKMHPIFNYCMPMAMGLRIDHNVYANSNNNKKVESKDQSIRSLHLCYPLGLRSRDCPFALNIGIFDNDDTSVTLVRKDVIDHGGDGDKQSLTAIYSLSAKWRRDKVWNGSSAPISWGAKLDFSGDLPSFPLHAIFGQSNDE